MLLRLVCLAGLLALVGCTDRAPQGGGDILVIGDSIMAWNGREDSAVGDVIQAQLRRQVIDRSVSGAQIANGSKIASFAGFDIPTQFPGGRWNWIIVNGGANDLGFSDCNCGDCSAEVDRLIGPTAQSGAILPFVETLLRSGTNVLWMGYYTSPGGGSFKGCGDDLGVLEGRIARLAKATAGLYFVDGGDVIDPNDPTLFASDRTHPSPKGSALLGTLLAKEIIARDERSQ